MEQDKDKKEVLDLFKDLLTTLPDEKLNSLYSAIQAALINLFLKAVDDVKRNKNLSIDEKLKHLVSPLMALSQPYTRRDQTYPFISESIRIEKELDLKNLVPNASKYRIDLEEGEPLEPSEPVIFLKDKFKRIVDYRNKRIAEGEEPAPMTLNAGYVSLKEIHKDWLQQLNPKTIKSRDLLDQILVAYTIKRALNGDKESIQKLYDLYEEAAQGIAVRSFKKYVPVPIEEIKQDAKNYLKFLITGFRPDQILSQLLTDESDGIIRSLPPWVKSFYLYYLSDYIPKWMEENIKESRENKHLITKLSNLSVKDGRIEKEVNELISFFKNRENGLTLQWLGIFNLYAPLHNGTFWKGTPKRINRFNNYSFQPGTVRMGPRKNLTTWLFGRRNEIYTLTQSKREDGIRGKAWQPYAKLYQLLRDKYKPLIKEKSKSKTFDFRDNFDEDSKGILSFENRTKALGVDGDSKKYRDKHINEMITKEAIKKIEAEVRRELLALCVPVQTITRNIRIYFRWKSDDLTQSEIAKECGLSTRQVKRICQQIKKLLPKVKKHLSLEE